MSLKKPLKHLKTNLKTKKMSNLYEKRVEIMCYLNDNSVEPDPTLNAITELLDIKHEDKNGWDMEDE